MFRHCIRLAVANKFYFFNDITQAVVFLTRSSSTPCPSLLWRHRYQTTYTG